MVLTTTSLLSFGWGGRKQLGHGSTEDCLNPKIIDGLRSMRVACAAAGLDHSAVVTADGELWTFGSGAAGQLGTGGMEDESTPLKVDLPKVLGVSCGGGHTVCFDADGRIWCFGRTNNNMEQT